MILASDDDRFAYAKIGGAIDNVSEAYPFVSKALSTVDEARDSMMNSGRLARFLKVTDKAQKVYSYVSKITDLVDETKRDGTILKRGIKVSTDIAKKLLGKSITTHPYFTYHKAHIEALADALNASRNSKAAVAAYRKAVSAASSMAVVKEFKELELRKVDLIVKHSVFSSKIGVAFDIARGSMSTTFARKKIAEHGDINLRQAVADLDAWRANWAGLCFDFMQLQIMAGNELNTATQAMNKVKELMAKMISGNNISRVGGYAAINAIEWEKYDQIINQKKPDQMAIDPVQYAQRTLDKAVAWGQGFTEFCDFVRSDEVIFQSYFNKQLDRLNVVLYG